MNKTNKEKFTRAHSIIMAVDVTPSNIVWDLMQDRMIRVNRKLIEASLSRNVWVSIGTKSQYRIALMHKTNEKSN